MYSSSDGFFQAEAPPRNPGSHQPERESAGPESLRPAEESVRQVGSFWSLHTPSPLPP